MGYARGLIKYTSEHQLQGGKTHLLRPRLVGYTAVLLVMIGALAVALAERPDGVAGRQQGPWAVP
jgi:polyferredoxin